MKEIRKKFRHRCLSGSYIRVCIVLNKSCWEFGWSLDHCSHIKTMLHFV